MKTLATIPLWPDRLDAESTNSLDAAFQLPSEGSYSQPREAMRTRKQR